MRASGSIVSGRISKRLGIATPKPKRESTYSWKSSGMGCAGVTSWSWVMRSLLGGCCHPQCTLPAEPEAGSGRVGPRARAPAAAR